MPVLAYSGTHKVSGQQGYSEGETAQTTVERAESAEIIAEQPADEISEEQTQTQDNPQAEVKDQKQEPEEKGSPVVKPAPTSKQVKEFYKAPSTGRRLAFSASSTAFQSFACSCHSAGAKSGRKICSQTRPCFRV